MQLEIRDAYNFDLVNMMNLLTGDPLYTKVYPEAYAEFGEALSDESREIISMITEALGSTMIAPLVNFAISFIPDFEDLNLAEILLDEEAILKGIEQNEPRMLAAAQQMAPLFQVMVPVLAELENMGFREYWLEEKRPTILEKQAEIRQFVEETKLDKEIAALLGAGRAPEEMTIYLCAFAAPHGTKVFGPRYISDLRFPLIPALLTAAQELFRPPYDFITLQETLDRLAADPFLKLAFEKKDPRYGYPDIYSYLSESVTQAMTLYIAHKCGLEPDPYGYFLKHEHGLHVFSVILLDYMTTHPKEIVQPFDVYFRELVEKMPVGQLMKAYQAVLNKAGKSLKTE